jgi:NAD(P)-dependent dehydrogenase (short-subunit alcohol dehydrogenase family)
MSKVAIVTGGGRGIGAVTAELLASRGWDVCVSYRKDAAAASEVTEACRRHGGRAIAVPADVAVEPDVVGLFARCDTELGTVTALVNNAAVVAPKARVDELDVERLQRLMAVNVIGPFLCAREAVRRMSTAHGGAGGVIVNVSSAAARIGSPGEYVDYAATKGAIDTMTLGLAKEVAAEGVRVNAVRPGIIDTTMHASGGQPDRVQRLGPQTPMQRAGEPGEIAAAIAWLCSDEATYVTGSLLDVAGGR